MIDVVAYMSAGGVIREESLPDEVRDVVSERLKVEGLPDYMFDVILDEEYGYSALSWFAIHEWESQNWSELPYMFDAVADMELEDWGEGKNVDYEAETVLIDGEWVDVSAYVGVLCDESGERIV